MQKIIPHLWYNTEAKQAAEFYVEVFNNNPHDPDKKESRIVRTTLLKNTPSGDCDLIEYELSGQSYMAISAGPSFTFNEAVSFLIVCNSQAEIDYFFEKLSAVPEAEVCGWCKDKFGLSWQVWTPEIGAMMSSGEDEKIARMQEVLFKMGKLDIAALKKAFDGE